MLDRLELEVKRAKNELVWWMAGLTVAQTVVYALMIRHLR